MRLFEVCCPNTECKDFGKGKCGNVTFFGTYRSKKGFRQRYRCQSCGRTFSERTGKVFCGLHTDEEKIFLALAHLAKKKSTKRVAKIAKVKLDTLHRWLHKAYTKQHLVGDILLEKYKLTPKQIEGLWKIIRKRAALSPALEPATSKSSPKGSQSILLESALFVLLQKTLIGILTHSPFFSGHFTLS